MDLTLPIIGLLSYAGYCFNKGGKTPRDTEAKRTKISPHSLPSGENIYNSTYSKTVNENEKKLMSKQFEDSKDPVNTNIIPPDFNSSKIYKGPMFNPRTLSHTQSEDTQLKSKKFEENFTNISDLTGNKMIKSHNNMIPHFGSTVKQNTRADATQSVLENFTGSVGFSKSASEREIVGSIFKPRPQVTTGTELFTNNTDASRYDTSILRTNETPVQSVKVKYSDALEYRPLPKDISELRVNQKESYSTPAITGSSYVKSRAANPELSKNRPETTFELGPERLFTALGAQVAPAGRGEFVRDINKKDISETQLNVNYGSYYSGDRQRLKNCGNTGDESIVLPTKKVSSSYKQDNYRNAKNIHDMSYIPLQTVPKTTHKESNLYEYSGIATSEVEGHRDYSAEYNNTRKTQHYNNPYYSGIAGNGNGLFNREQFLNHSVKTSREDIDSNKGYIPGPQNINIGLGASNMNFGMKEEIVDKQIFRNAGSSIGNTVSPGLVNTKLKEMDISDRLSEELLSSYKENPYAHHYC